MFDELTIRTGLLFLTVFLVVVSYFQWISAIKNGRFIQVLITALLTAVTAIAIWLFWVSGPEHVVSASLKKTTQLSAATSQVPQQGRSSLSTTKNASNVTIFTDDKTIIDIPLLDSNYHRTESTASESDQDSTINVITIVLTVMTIVLAIATGMVFLTSGRIRDDLDKERLVLRDEIDALVVSNKQNRVRYELESAYVFNRKILSEDGLPEPERMFRNTLDTFYSDNLSSIGDLIDYLDKFYQPSKHNKLTSDEMDLLELLQSYFVGGPDADNRQVQIKRVMRR